MSYFPTEPTRPEHERARNLMRFLLGNSTVRQPMGLLDPRGVAIAQAANAAGRQIPPGTQYEDFEPGTLTNSAQTGFRNGARDPAVTSAFASTDRLRPEHERARDLMRFLLGDGPARRPMGLLDPRGVALAQAANAAGRYFTKRSVPKCRV